MAGSAAARRGTVLSRRPLLVTAIVLPIAIFTGVAAFDFRAERNEVRDQILATTTAFAEHAQTVVETTDLVLARVLARTEAMDWGTIQSSAGLHAFLLKLKEDLPQVDSIFLVSPEGRSVATTRTFPVAAAPSVADRDYFTEARQGGTGTYVSTPYESRMSGSYAFAATRARVRDGGFDGLVGVTISPAYFRDFYAEAMNYPGESAATFVRNDGTILFRYPAYPAALGRLSPYSAFLRAAAANGERGTFEGASTIDGRLRLGAYRRLRNQPLFVSYSVDASAYLRTWRVNLLLIGVFSTLLAAVLLLTERVVTRRTEAEKRAAEALLAETDRRRQAELALEQMQKMEALGRLTGGVAHDFNNLLTAILGPLELAAKRSDDPRVLRLLSAASSAAQRGARLTAQMLAVARKREAVAAPLDPNAVIRGVADMLARTIGPMIRLSTELDLAASPVSADVVQMEMMLVNLCVNARDAMPEGGELVIRTRTARLDAAPPEAPGLAAGDYIRLSVTDTGEGMTEEVRAHALEPFFTTKGPGKGTGLGLSTAYGFAKSAGGYVSIDSAPGAGTTIAITLPRSSGTPVAEAPPVPAGVSRPVRILLVDDDEAVRVATRETLEEFGHTIVEAPNGPAALQHLDADRGFDLLVTDFAMPGMNGSQVAEAARLLAPDLPVLFVTGYAKDDVLAAWDSRRGHTLDKPFSAADLARAVYTMTSPLGTG